MQIFQTLLRSGGLLPIWNGKGYIFDTLGYKLQVTKKPTVLSEIIDKDCENEPKDIYGQRYRLTESGERHVFLTFESVRSNLCFEACISNATKEKQS